MKPIIELEHGGYFCRKCKRGPFKYRDSGERHAREKHGSAFEKEQARERARQANLKAKQQSAYARHQELMHALVKAALDWHRAHGQKVLVVYRATWALSAAAKALDGYETGKTK